MKGFISKSVAALGVSGALALGMAPDADRLRARLDESAAKLPHHANLRRS